MKLIAVVITYYPDLSESIENISRYIDHVDQLVIWENTPLPDQDRYKIILPDHQQKVTYMGTGKNEGIGYPLNRVAEYALVGGYTHLLTMDQDSFFADFYTYKQSVMHYTDRAEIGIFTPNVNQQIKSDQQIQTVAEAITSGTIYKLDIFAAGLRFREDFFIDMVDNEFCYKAFRNHFQTAVLPHCSLIQKFGQTARSAIGVYSLNYSAFRIYHILRNFIITWREYPDLIQGKWGFIPKAVVNRVLKIIFLEQDKRRKLRAVYWGLRDGLAGRVFERVF